MILFKSVELAHPSSCFQYKLFAVDHFSSDQKPTACTGQLSLLELVNIFWCTYKSKLRPEFLVLSDLQEVTKKATVIIIIIITESDGALIIEFCSHARSLKNKCCLSLPVLNLLIIIQTSLCLFFFITFYYFLCFFLHPHISREQWCHQALLRVLLDTGGCDLLWLDN